MSWTIAIIRAFLKIFASCFGPILLLMIGFWNLDWLLNGPSEISGAELFSSGTRLEIPVAVRFLLQLAIAPTLLLHVYLATRYGIPLVERLTARRQWKATATAFTLLAFLVVNYVAYWVWHGIFFATLGSSRYLNAFDLLYQTVIPTLIPAAVVLGVRSVFAHEAREGIGRAMERVASIFSAAMDASPVGTIGAILSVPILIEAAFLADAIPAVIFVYGSVAYCLGLSLSMLAWLWPLRVVGYARDTSRLEVSDGDASGAGQASPRPIRALIAGAALVPSGPAVVIGSLLLASALANTLHGPDTLNWALDWATVVENPAGSGLPLALLLGVPVFIGIAQFCTVARLAIAR